MFGQMSRGDAAVGAMRVAFDRFREWPARSTRALQDGTFKVPHARLVQVCCSRCCSGFRPQTLQKQILLILA